MSSSLQYSAMSSSQEAPASSAPKPHSKPGALFRNNLKWDSHKDTIRQFYIAEDHTLKETMDFVLRDCRFKASERKWKDKLKEWEFEKNIPAKDMAFMAAKSIKRKSEEAKDTIFYRSGILVDEDKVEQFKKRRLGGGNFNDHSVPETPPQVIYSTPRLQIPSLNEEDDYLENAAECGLSLTNVDAESNNLPDVNVPSNLQQDIPLEPPLPNDDQPMSSQADEVAEGDGRNYDWRMKVLENENDSITALESMMGAFKLAHSLQHPERSSSPSTDDPRAVDEIRCIQNIRDYIDLACVATIPRLCVLESYMMELLACLEDSDDNSIHLSAQHTLTFYNMQVFSTDSIITRSVDSTLCKLLKRCGSSNLTESTLSMMLAELHCRNENDPLRLGFQTTLQNLLSNRNANTLSNLDLFRFMTVSFAWTLDLGSLDITFASLGPTFSRIEEAATQLWEVGWKDTRTKLPSFPISRILELLKEHAPGVETYAFVLNNAVLLASDCSAEQMYSEAEAIFFTICAPRNWRRLNLYSASKITTLLLYCLHLKRQERWKELLVAIEEICDEITKIPLDVDIDVVAEDIYWARSIMKNISGQNLSATEMRQWLELDGRLKEIAVVSRPSAPESLSRQEEGEMFELDDSKSTNAYGVTYTDSGISSISFNYSNLWK